MVSCGFLLGGGGDDKDVRFESSKALAWSCATKAQVYPWKAFEVGSVFIRNVSHVEEWKRSSLCNWHTTLLCSVVQI